MILKIIKYLKIKYGNIMNIILTVRLRFSKNFIIKYSNEPDSKKENLIGSLFFIFNMEKLLMVVYEDNSSYHERFFVNHKSKFSNVLDIIMDNQILHYIL